MRDPAGRSRGFAFLTFEDPSAVNKVMVQEHFLDGKIVGPQLIWAAISYSFLCRSIPSAQFLALNTNARSRCLLAGLLQALLLRE